MSELVTTFVFDLQRFDKVPDSTKTPAYAFPAAADIVPDEINTTSVSKDKFYWKSEADAYDYSTASTGIIATCTVDKKTATKDADGKTVEKANQVTYYVVSNVTALEISAAADFSAADLPSSVKKITLKPAAASFSGAVKIGTLTYTLAGTLSKNDAFTISNGEVTDFVWKPTAGDKTVKVEGANGDPIKINGSPITTNGKEFTYTYNKDGSTLFVDSTTTEVTAAGDAKSLHGVTIDGNTVTSVEINGVEYSGKITGGSAAPKSGDKIAASYFLLDGKSNVTGVVLGTDQDAITITKDTSKLQIWYAETTDSTKPKQLTAVPTVTGVDDYTITFTQGASAAANSFSMSVAEGAVAKVGSTTVEFATLSTDDTDAAITFNKDGAITGVIGIKSPEDEIVVTGATSEKLGKGGIYIGENASSYAGTGTDYDKIYVKSGKFTYFIPDDNGSAGAPQLRLTETTDTVFGTGAVTQVVPAEGSGTVTFGKTAYKYTIGDSGFAYFTVTPAAAGTDLAPTAFNFGEAGDALTLPADSTVTYTFGEGGTGSLTSAPTVTTKGNYTITFVDDTTDAEVFEISDLVAKSEVTVGTPKFTFSEVDGGAIQFNDDGALGMTVPDGGKVTMTANPFEASDPEDTSTFFKINGTGVNIVATADATNGMVYDSTDKSLSGVSDVEVYEAGDIKKIFTGAKVTDTAFTFEAGEETPTEFTVTTANKSEAFFTVDGAKATGFQFSKAGDILQGDFSALTLYDEDGSSFTAPKITTIDDPETVKTEGQIQKTKTGFQINAEQGDIVTFGDNTKLTFEAVDADAATVVFDKKGALVSVAGVKEAGDTLIIDGAPGQVTIDEVAYEITGAAWTYQINDDEEPTIRDLTSGIKVVNAGNATELWTKGGENGTFKFGGASFAIAGVDNDTVEGEEGVMFKWDDTNKKATAIDSLDENTSVTGNFNGMSIAGGEEALNVTDGTYVLFGGGKSMAGLAAGGEVVAAGGVSDFLTNAAASAKFTVLKTELTVTDKDGVTFQTNGKDSLLGVAALEGEVVGDFTGGLSVNSVAVSVTNDSVVAVVGDDKGVTAVNQLGVADATAKIEVTAAGASVFGVNENGTFVFNGAHSFAVAGNGDSVTSFDFTAETAAITGVDKTETLSGDFSAATSVNGNVLQVAGDSSISLVGGTQILGLTGGASVIQANGISSAVTDGEGTFTFVQGGQSFKVTGGEVEFLLDGKGKVIGISGVDDGEIVTGDLNNIVINGKEPEIIVQHEDGSYNTNLYYENGTLSGIVDGDTVVKADNVKTVIAGTSGTFKFADKEQTFMTTDADGVVFSVVEGTTEVTAVASLAAAASLEGSIGGLSVNGKKVDIQNDTEFGVIGAADGIDGVYKLSDGAIVVDAAGATVASTDSFGTFKFQTSGQSFVVAGDSGIDFALTDNAVTAINGLSAGSVLGSFSGITGVNGQTFAVADSDNKVEVFADAEGKLSKIDKVTADATIGEVGSVSQVITDKAGKFEFTVGGQSFITGDGADVVTFGLSSSAVTAIDNLNGSAIGGFSGITVNGADIDITDGDGQLKVFGDGTKLTAIQDVDADATINKAGGVAELVGNIAASSGSFTFANSGEFKVEGDSSVTFALNTAADAEVVGISDLNGAVTGSFSGISSVNGKTFSVVDADGVLTVYGDGSDITKIAGVTGSASIGQVGGVSQILTDKAGEFAFTNGSWSVAGDDEVTFGMSSSKVVSISELVGTVTGAFEDVTVNGQNFQISGDSSIALVGGASGVTAIEKLSGGADIARAEGTLTATTDSEGTFSFANGRTIQVLGDSSVVFGLNNGLVMSIDDLDETATIIGAINQIAINGSSSMFDVRNNANLWYSNGTLSAVVDGNTIVSADGATTVQVVTPGTYTFGNGAFEIAGDQDGTAQFTVSDSSIATAINGVDAGATVTGALNGMAINGGSALVVENDDSFGAVAGDGVLAKLINLSDGANVVEAGGASQFVTDAEGQFTILGTAMQIESDDEVTFTADANGITAIDGLEGTATGDFRNEILVNENAVQILNDSLVAVSSEGAEVTAIDQVSDGATVAAVGGAVEVGTDTEGSFTFAVAGDSQAFTVEEDAEVTFQLEEGAVVGVNELENGKLTFDTATTALTLNDDESFTIQTSTNASFSVADNSVNYVTGVDGAIEGLVNGTVVATGAMEVNGTNIDVQDDNDFKVIVQDGEVVGLADISGGAKVNVAGVSIAVDSNGELEIGGKQYSFNDSIDGAFNLTTGDESALTGVDAFAGEMVIAAPADQALTVNGDALGFLSTADSVTVNSDGVEVTAVNGLVNNDAVTVGAGASIAMPGSTASVRGEGSFLKVNEVTYELLNDDNGVTVTGGRQVTDLNESASLFVSEKGKYTVNGNTSDIEVEDTNMPIIGLDNATDAYIYDPAHLIVRKSTPVSEIEAMLGLPTEYETKFGGDDVNHETADPTDDPLDSAGLSSMFANEDLDQPAEIFATNDEKTAQDINLADTDFSKKLHLFNGDQNVTFNDAGGNLAVVELESSGRKNIALGDMGDAVISKADAGNGSQVNVVGGAGDDSVVVQGSAPVNFDMSEGGADKVITFASSGARITLEGYNALTNPNAGIQITERWTKNLADAIANGLLSFGNGEMSIGNDASGYAKISFEGNTAEVGAVLVNLFNYLGQKQAVGFTNSGGGLVDGSTAQDPLILIGNDKGQKTGNSTLLGGSGDDTAIAGGGDNIDLGDGNNVAQLQDDINREGADIVIGTGRTTINNFNGTFNAQHGDVIKIDLSNANISFVNGNVYLEGEGFYGVIADAKPDGAISYDAAADVTESADLVESADSSSASVLATAQGDYTNVLFDDEGVIAKTAIAKTGGVIDVKLDFDARANNYIGDNSGLTFYDHTGEVFVNLGTGTGSIDTEAVTYSGINKVAAGAGQTTMIGGESNETLIAGQGTDSIWGAGGKNLLMGYNDVANDKTGQTSFFVVAEADGAANTLRGFNFVDDDSWNVNTNQITADKLDIQVQYDYIDAERDVDISGDDVVLFVNNRNKESSESVVIEDARGKNFVVSGNDIVNDVVAQVNTDNLVADKFANYFVATGKNATLTVGNDIDTANIYLDNKTPDGSDYLGDVPQFYGDIHVIDASGSNAKVELGGNLYDNTIIGGTGDASLWGGDGGNDLLVGGTGANTFFYNAGDGNDTITGAHDGDVVDLTNVQLSDIVDANSAITSSGVELKFKDGGSLTVNSTADVAYKVGEDTYVVNDDRDGWTKK